MKDRRNQTAGKIDETKRPLHTSADGSMEEALSLVYAGACERMHTCVDQLKQGRKM
jgi:hypothetical protein